MKFQLRDRQTRKSKSVIDQSAAGSASYDQEETIDKLINLLHASTTAIVPPSPQPFDLLTPDQHGGRCVWEDLSRRHLIYLGDAVSLVFARKSVRELGGDPVLLEITVKESLLEPDPAFLKARENLIALQGPDLGTSLQASLFWSGRAATTGPVTLTGRYVCTGTEKFFDSIEDTSLVRHVEFWHIGSVWEQAASQTGETFKSGAAWRASVGNALVAQFFKDY